MKAISINNETQGRKIGFYFTMFTVALIAILAATLLFEIKKELIVQISCLSLLVLAVLLFKLGGFYYLIIELKNDVLEIKFYTVFPYGRKFKMIRAEINQLDRVEYSNGLLGVGRSLSMYQKKKDGSAKYPVIGLSALSKADFTKLNEVLRID